MIFLKISQVKRLGYSTLVFLLFGCGAGSKNQERNEPLVAQVGDLKLFRSDIVHLVPPHTSVADSAAIVDVYIENWIRQHVIILASRKDSTLDRVAIEKKVSAMRDQLLVYEYQRHYIETHLDTSVTYGDIEAYYAEHETEFELNAPIMRGIFIKVPKTAPDVNQMINAFYRSKDPLAQEEVKLYSTNFAKSYFLQDSTWVMLSVLTSDSPFENSNPVSLVKSAKYLKRSDDTFHYLLKIEDYRLPGDIAPAAYKRDEIRTIILGQRKQALLEEMENKLYENAVKAKNVERFE